MLSEARPENVGLIRRAAIGDHKLSVFAGPNCPGKSVAARLPRMLRIAAPARIRAASAWPSRPARAGPDRGGR